MLLAPEHFVPSHGGAKAPPVNGNGAGGNGAGTNGSTQPAAPQPAHA
jgi:hypothetical protein